MTAGTPPPVTAPAKPPSAAEVLARRVRELCDERRWNARDLAREAGVCHASVYRILNAENTSLLAADIVAGALGFSLGTLLSGPGCACPECGAKGAEVTR